VTLGPYRAIVSARFRMMLQYRAAAIAGLWTQVFFGLVLIMVYESFYRSSSAAVQPMALDRVVSYVWLGQALLAMIPWNAEPEVRAMVRSGAVAYELCRPVDLYWLWFVRGLAWRTAPTLLRAVPMVILAMVVLPLIGLPEWRLAPPTLPAGLGFTLAVCAALGLSCAITTLFHISLLWTVSGEGIVMIGATAVSLCSGLLVPLPLFPDWARGVLEWLPFAGLADLPFRVYTGDIPLGELSVVLARQVGWTVALVALGRWLLARGMRRLVVQGG
jgi:ABC-2 type transport system permease protein